ncbi:MAG: hypothetical protein ACFB15_31415 [Cyclobacteriaceae bacterium]
MGTDSPNPRAVLELVATENDQGLLVPRLSDSNLTTLANQLTANDRGLLVFAQDQGVFCYWWNDQWKVLQVTAQEDSPASGGLEYLSGNGITIEGQYIRNTGDLDSTNELQSLASVLRRGQDADQQRITNVADPVDEQDVATRAFVTRQLSTLTVPTLQYNDTTKALSLSGSSAVDLGAVNTDEQDLSLDGNTLSLTNDSSPVSLSATSPVNGQVLTWNSTLNRWESQAVVGGTSYTAGSGISINGSNQIANTAPDQTVNLSGGGSVTIGGTYPNFTITGTDLVDDADNSPTNEIQDLSLSSNTLTITNHGSATPINLSPYLDNTDQQTLSLTGTSLAISDGNSVNIGGINSDNQTLSLSSNTLSITDGNAVNLAGINTDAQELSLSGTTLGISGNPTTVDLSVVQDGTGTDSQSLSNSKTATDVSVTISGGNTTTFSVADNDNDTTNETITSASLETGDILRITEAGTNHDVDLSGFQKTALPAGQVLVGNASSVATPMSISGDITFNSDGTMTINLDAVTTAKILNQAVTTAKLADDAVTKEKINSDVAGNGLSQAADGSLQTVNTASGELLIGQGSGASAQVISGDIALAADGSTTVEGIQGRPVSTTAPLSGQVLTWDGSSWVPEDAGGLALFGSQGWYSGSGAPTALNPLLPSNGDFYFDRDNEIVYYRESGSWRALGGFNTASPAPINMGGDADSYRTPITYIGDAGPVDGDDIGADGDFYYSRDEEQLYYRYDDTGTIRWKVF